MKCHIYVARLFVLLTFVVWLTALYRQPVQAQPETPKVEWSVQSSTLHLSDFDAWKKGLGSRATYNLNRHLSLEGEVNVFPAQNTAAAFRILEQYVGDWQIEGLFGVKAGARFSRFGFFGKLRPGIMHFGERNCSGPCLSNGAAYRLPDGSVVPFPQSLNGKTLFALDMGGGLEFYFARHLAFRLDVGDTLIRHSQPNHNSHNLQIGTGLGWRF